MILYFAGEWSGREGRLTSIMQQERIDSVLISFAYARDVKRARAYMDELRAGGVRRIFLDSGAFTAWSKGEPIDRLEYQRAVEVLEPDVYSQLDVIGDPVGTRENLLAHIEDGFAPLPVFTRGAPWSDLHRLVSEGYDYICLGNIAKASTTVRREWLRGVFSTLGPGVRTHGFGVTQAKMLLEFPFYSADSSAAVLASAWGSVLEFRDGVYGQRDPGRREKYAWRMPHLTDKVVGRPVYDRRRLENVRALNAMARHVTKVWAERGITWPDQEEHPS